MGKEKRYAGLYTAERARAVERTADEMGYDYEVVARPGEAYQLTDGGSNLGSAFTGPRDVVHPGMVVASIPVELEEDHGDEFWRKVAINQRKLKKVKGKLK